MPEPRPEPHPSARVTFDVTGVEALVKFLDAVRAIHAKMDAREVTYEEATRQLDIVITTLEGEVLG